MNSRHVQDTHAQPRVPHLGACAGGIRWPEMLGPLAALILPLAVYASLRLHPALDVQLMSPLGHTYVVTGTSVLAAGLAVAVGIAGARLRNLQVIFLSLAFVSLSLVFALHGLTTSSLLPGTTEHAYGYGDSYGYDFTGDYSEAAITTQVSVSLTALWLWLSSRPSDGWAMRWLGRRERVLVPAWTALVLVATLVGAVVPGAIDRLPTDVVPINWTVGALTLLLAGAAGYRYFRSYLYSRFPLQRSIVYAAVCLCGAQVIVTTSVVWRLSWWLYHLLLLAAVVLMIAGLVRQYGEGVSLATAVRGLFATDPRERLAAGLSPAVRALIVATEARDVHTAGHSYRVALHALQLAESMHLPPEDLRALAQGGLVHDVGKLEVPDQILNKPGPLSSEERRQVERHPVTAYQMCRVLGFMRPELAVIRHHHERWDGTGYPDGLRGEEIPLLARILAVADVYDALTSARSYRGPWSHEQARAYLLEAAGTQFDPHCVEVWAQIAGPVARPEPLPGWLVTGWSAG